MMASRGTQHSNSPTAFDSGKRALTGNPSRELVAKGLVSARIHAYQVHEQQAEDVASAYPPSLPRVRLEMVRLQEGWPTHNADLYNQEHPRTMSLASESSQYDRKSFRYRLYDHAARHSQTSLVVSNGSRVTNLLRLYESQRQTHRKLPPHQLGHTASSGKDDAASVGRPPQCYHHSYRPKSSTEELGEPCLADSPLSQVNLRFLESDTQLMARNEALSRTSVRPFSEVPARMARYGVMTCNRTSAADSSSDDCNNNGNYMATPYYQSGSSTPELGRHTPSDWSQTTRRGMPCQSTGLVGCWERSKTQPASKCLESNGQQYMKSTVRGSSSSGEYPKALNPAQKTIGIKRQTGPLIGKPDRERGFVLRRRAGSGDIRGMTPLAEKKVTPESSSPSTSRIPGMVRVSRDRLPCRASSAMTSSNSSSLSEFPIHPSSGWQDKRPYSSCTAKRDTASRTSTVSSKYFSIGGSKPSSEHSREDGRIAGKVKTPEQTIQASVDWPISSALDAATQTDPVESDPGSSASRWSDNDRVGRHGRVHAYQRISRHTRSQRRMRRLKIHKVHVIISLDVVTEAQSGRSTLKRIML